MGTERKFYTGLHRHSLDDKGRLTIPSVWRAAHDESARYLATPHPDGYIAILPPPEVDKLYEKISAMKMSNAKAQSFSARFFSRTQDFSFDKAGRVVLSDELCKHAGIEKEAVLVGTMTKFHIYSPARWQQEEASSEGDNFGEMMREADL